MFLLQLIDLSGLGVLDTIISILITYMSHKIHCATRKIFRFDISPLNLYRIRKSTELNQCSILSCDYVFIIKIMITSLYELYL